MAKLDTSLVNTSNPLLLFMLVEDLRHEQQIKDLTVLIRVRSRHDIGCIIILQCWPVCERHGLMAEPSSFPGD
jgi:hypothetical protein